MAKAYTYNIFQDDLLSHIFTDDGGSWSANLVDSTAFDYFPDAAAVDDAIYFMDDEYFRNIRLYIGTAFAATSVTFVWEYYSYDAGDWAALSNVTNENAFENAGQQDVTWDLPTDWVFTTVNGASYRLAIRCRISAVSNPTEGGAQSTQVVEAGDNKIIATGGTSGDRLTIHDIYDEDVANGWGAIERLVDDVPKFLTWWNARWRFYRCLAKIEVGDGVTQDYADYPQRTYLYMQGAGNIIYFQKCDCLFGRQHNVMSVLLNGILGYNRSSLNFLDEYCDVTAYNTLFSFQSRVNAAGYIKLKADGTYTDCIFEMADQAKIAWIGFWGSTTLTRCKVIDEGLMIRADSVVIQDIIILNGAAKTYGATIDTLELIPDAPISIYGYDTDASFINVTGASEAKFQSFGTMWIKWDFDLRAIDSNGDGISGASVTIIDADDTEVFSGTTDANGDIEQQELVEMRYEKTTSGFEVIPFDDFDDKTPHTVTISKTGYETRTIKYTMDRTREEIEMLATLDTTAPTFDGCTSATDRASDGEVLLEWDAATDADTGVGGYNIYYSTVNDAATILAAGVQLVSPSWNTSVIVGGLTNDTPYYFIVRAKDKAIDEDGVASPNEDTNEVVKSATPTFLLSLSNITADVEATTVTADVEATTVTADVEATTVTADVE